ncbi:MAG: glycogen debranching enzyme N-terminal domain-containing protein [Deltaproteobacteria bacterium]|nr:glycogen debranching enzyme N-terminal domain-containing protein [Deltaproteobacteria bacterium]
MNNSISITQFPAPGAHLLLFRGDTITFTLLLSCKVKGYAWLRTNIGHAGISRREIIREVHHDEPSLGRDWFDIPMIQVGKQNFQVVLPLCEVGHFQAKCMFSGKAGADPIWPDGPNAVINVEPSDTCCANIIYNAFVRQFGSIRKGGKILDPTEETCIKSLDSFGYSVIPSSGTFRDMIKELDFIMGELGCRIIQLLPIHPTPVTYARMGRFGSPYAALNFTSVDPALAEFDQFATPMEQFVELVDAIHERCGKIVIDIAINHTGWAAALHETHPEWLVRDKEGRIEAPGAWGTTWEDLTRLDYTRKDLWKYMAEVFLLWCRRGLDGFRCDAGYMIPVNAWEYIVARVRDQYPDTIFILEGLGGKISVTRDILNKAGFNMAYSELFQNYDRRQVETYLPEPVEISQSDGIMVHFAETHDNNRLAERSTTYAMMRTALCALCSHNGAFGFANGVEWFATEKIDVHDAVSLNWGADINQVQHIRRLNRLLKVHPAFHDMTDLRFIHQGGGNQIALLRRHIPSGRRLIIVANLDDKHKTIAEWQTQQVGMTGLVYIDLLTEKEIDVTISGGLHTYLLDPGQVLCLTDNKNDIDLLQDAVFPDFILPERLKRQQLRAKALDVFCYYNKINSTRPLDRSTILKDERRTSNNDVALLSTNSPLGYSTTRPLDYNPDYAAQQLADNPVEYCRSVNNLSNETRVITWQWPRDLRREVMVPPDYFLMVRSISSFCAEIVDRDRIILYEKSLQCSDGSFFVLLSPLFPSKVHRSVILKMSVYTPGKCEHIEAPILFLCRPEDVMIKKCYKRTELLRRSLLLLGTNGRGGMRSRYDALLAANLNPEFPEDRRIMFTRCRAWVVFQGYSQGISIDCIDSFCFDYNSRGVWRYFIPTGQGEHVLLAVRIEMIPGENAVKLLFSRHSAEGREGKLADSQRIKLILRPDIEDRNFHENTKAYQGPEHLWPKAVKIHPGGFTFSSETGCLLNIEIFRGRFVSEPEWHYMVRRPADAERGIDPDSDLFSPGYFTAFLKGGQTAELYADIVEHQKEKRASIKATNNNSECLSECLPEYLIDDGDSWKLNEALKKALDHYVVKRGNFKTVIAGYPWFLDWGRDALIFARGLIAAGNTGDARDILHQFGRFEEGGTLPNMIRGESAENRDTSDASLWFFVVCSDLINAEKSEAFLDAQCHGRRIRDILVSIGLSMIAGTFNGIRMDRESGLIFSPSHFTWMDTNHPAGTPREGYPIEIQALWFFALAFLARVDNKGKEGEWEKLASQVRSSIYELYWMEEEGYLSDCLHACSKKPARQADRDDALRPNQLLAVTLGAVTDKTVIRKIVEACEELLVPGAIRSLADRPVHYPLEIVYNGDVINDPYNPYYGEYAGDEDTKRKLAYHNGTAWTWLFPAFCEAWVKAYGDQGRDAALAWLGSSARLINQGCVGHVPEILDGDFPHKQRGCDAQAWGASELLRVWNDL